MNYLIVLWCWFGMLDRNQLIIEVSEIEKIRGNIMIAVTDSKSTFLTKEVFASGVFEVTGSVITCPLELPLGIYAVSVYQDVNLNGKLDSNLLGIPKEPVGFSNNAKGSFGPPKFDDVIFDFKRDRQVIKIEMF